MWCKHVLSFLLWPCEFRSTITVHTNTKKNGACSSHYKLHFVVIGIVCAVRVMRTHGTRVLYEKDTIRRVSILIWHPFTLLLSNFMAAYGGAQCMSLYFLVFFTFGQRARQKKASRNVCLFACASDAA